ncbi:MAG: S9 family peptidase [Crocinitomicaceae bacterium]|nr:S9 family peptidase [Flavobacteriales bacterium]NQZ35598.1 S9 family peptidase [Crocinitomicaceae bacterium]
MIKIFYPIAAIILASCSTTDNMIQAPQAKKIEKTITTHGDSRVDNYFWMRLSDEQKEAETPDAQTKDVLDYLNAENDYLEQVMKPTEGLQETLYEEIVGRIKQDDQSVPVKVNGYLYYSRFEEGQDYPLMCRKKGDKNGLEEVLLNMPEMAKDQSYFSVGGQSISENNQLLAYSVDLVSRRQYTIHFKNLVTGELYSDEIQNTTGGITWANDNKTVFYTKQDPVTLRSNQIYKHVLGTPVDQDVLVYEEADETFGCSVYKTKSRKFIIIACYQTLSTEYRFLDADDPNGTWKIFQERERDLEYSIDHFGDNFYVTTNLDAKNFRLMKTPLDKTEKSNWTEVIGHREDVYLEDIDIFKNQLVVTERKNGLIELRIIKWADKSEYYIEFNDPAYTAYTFSNPEFDTDILRFGYTSLTTPQTTYDYNMNSKAKEMLKQQEVLGGKFSPDNYTSERIMVTARDGAQVPVSIVYKKGFKRDGNAPILLYAYGSYGYSMDPTFSSIRLSLLDRGFAFAIAHIRGGQEMGRDWYENGKLLKKKNTFYDFIDCGKYLVENKYTSSDHLYAQGGSAGGLLMGAISNMAPELWNGVIAQVPFVDVVSTMLDESIPLTTGEFDEWGNPKEKVYYDYIKSYSPYDNIEKKDYPNLLITTGYWDSQVQYWEPAKWIAKLRELKTNDNQLLMRCNMDVGHGGASGRFKRYREVAIDYAFLLQLEEIGK